MRFTKAKLTHYLRIILGNGLVLPAFWLSWASYSLLTGDYFGGGAYTFLGLIWLMIGGYFPTWKHKSVKVIAPGFSDFWNSIENPSPYIVLPKVSGGRYNPGQRFIKPIDGDW